jgi:DNA-binding XRE family transcriptional regulator
VVWFRKVGVRLICFVYLHSCTSPARSRPVRYGSHTTVFISWITDGGVVTERRKPGKESERSLSGPVCFTDCLSIRPSVEGLDRYRGDGRRIWFIESNIQGVVKPFFQIRGFYLIFTFCQHIVSPINSGVCLYYSKKIAVTSIFFLQSPIYSGMVFLMKQKQYILAGKIGVSPSLLSKIFLGRRQLSWPLAARLASIFPARTTEQWRQSSPGEIKRALNSLETE